MIIEIILLIILVLIVVFAVIGIYLVRSTLYPQAKDYEETKEIEITKGYFSEEYFNELAKEEIYLDSEDDYKIHAIWVPSVVENKGKRKAIIIAHGYSYTLFGSFKYLKFFREMGFDVMVYDERYHGLSGGENSTFGFKESLDLKTVTDEVIRRVGPEAIIGTHGESLGGATVLMHAAKDERISFAISDCAFMDMADEIAYQTKLQINLPKYPLICFASLINKIAMGVFYSEVSPIREVDKIKVPVMIIHGDSDKFTPYEHGLKLYEKLKTDKYFYGAEGADHAMSFSSDPARYIAEIKQFLNKYVY